MHEDSECSALRAELEARKDEIATLRGVVAALRVVAGRHDARAQADRRASAQKLAVVVAGGTLVGLALAIAWLTCLHR